MTEALVLLPQPRALARHAGQHQLDGARRIALDGACPDWFMPNADARGYYRFDLDAKLLTEVRALAGE